MTLYDIPMPDAPDDPSPTSPEETKPPTTPPPPSSSYATSSPFSTPSWDRPTPPLPTPPPPLPSPYSLPRPPPPPPASHPSHPNFTYSAAKGGLLYLSIPRFPASVIKNLLSRRRSDGPWVAAQLAHWGVPCPEGADPATQRRELEEAVLAGELEGGVPEEVRVVEEAVKAVWETQAAVVEEEWRVRRFDMCRTREEEVDIDPERFLRKYFPSGFGGDVPFPGAGAGEEAVVLGELREPEGLVEAVKGVVGLGCWVTKKRAVVGWRAGLVQAVAAAFDEIAADVRAWGDPWWVATAEAQFEMDRFFAKYFLEGMYGRPMPRKTPKPVTVRGWVGNQAFRHQLVGVVQQIHGLSACWFTKEDGEESCIIGWGDRPVEELHRLEAEKAQRVADAERIRLEEEGRPWREALYPHFQYLRERLVHPQGPFCVNHLVGSWLVKCPRLEAEWGGKPGKMTLDIVDQPLSEHGVLAAMDLALFRGTMLIAPDSGKLGKLSDALSAYTSDDEARLPHGGYMVKKSSRAAGHKPPRVSDNRVSEVEPGLGRVVLHWMGRQVGEGDVEIDEDEENRNMGQLDLDLANRAAGRGTFVYPAFFGRNIPVEFWVYKISDQPRDVPEKWTHFCPEPSPEYEYAFWGHSGWRC